MSYNPAFGMPPALTMNQYPGAPGQGMPPGAMPPGQGMPPGGPPGGMPPGAPAGVPQAPPGMIPGLGPPTPAGGGLPGNIDPATLEAMQKMAHTGADQGVVTQQLARAKALRGAAADMGQQAVTKTSHGSMVAPPNYMGALAGALANYKAGQLEGQAQTGTEGMGDAASGYAKQRFLEAGKKFKGADDEAVA